MSIYIYDILLHIRTYTAYTTFWSLLEALSAGSGLAWALGLRRDPGRDPGRDPESSYLLQHMHIHMYIYIYRYTYLYIYV